MCSMKKGVLDFLKLKVDEITNFYKNRECSDDDAYSPYCHALTVHEVIMHINQLKEIYFPKVREIVELKS